MTNENALTEMLLERGCIIVQGNYASGKEELCRKALDNLTSKSHFITLSCIEPQALTAFLDNIPEGNNILFSDFDKVKFEWKSIFALEIIHSVRIRKHRVLVTTLPIQKYSYEASLAFLSSLVTIEDPIVYMIDELNKCPNEDEMIGWQA